jgi:hypothetical protein
MKFRSFFTSHEVVKKTVLKIKITHVRIYKAYSWKDIILSFNSLISFIQAKYVPKLFILVFITIINRHPIGYFYLQCIFLYTTAWFFAQYMSIQCLPYYTRDLMIQKRFSQQTVGIYSCFFDYFGTI